MLEDGIVWEQMQQTWDSKLAFPITDVREEKVRVQNGGDLASLSCLFGLYWEILLFSIGYSAFW